MLVGKLHSGKFLLLLVINLMDKYLYITLVQKLIKFLHSGFIERHIFQLCDCLFFWFLALNNDIWIRVRDKAWPWKVIWDWIGATNNQQICVNGCIARVRQHNVGGWDYRKCSGVQLETDKLWCHQLQLMLKASPKGTIDKKIHWRIEGDKKVGEKSHPSSIDLKRVQHF